MLLKENKSYLLTQASDELTVAKKDEMSLFGATQVTYVLGVKVTGEFKGAERCMKLLG